MFLLLLGNFITKQLFSTHSKQRRAIFCINIARIFTVYYVFAICFFYASGSKPTLPQHSFSFLGIGFFKPEIAKLIDHIRFTIKLSVSFMHSTTRSPVLLARY